VPVAPAKIDFEALRRRFKESKHKNTDLEVLKAAIRAQFEKLICLNKTRADFAEKFEELVESYNHGSRNIEELFLSYPWPVLIAVPGHWEPNRKIAAEAKAC
jgi:type I restriction enzyme R subunit